MKTVSNPLVSVVLCFYNEEKFIEESVQSILDQEYKNWELILVDDGSKDKSTAMAKRYAENYPDKIFYLDHKRHANRGLSASRNAGIRNAHGDFIAFIDADDVWLSNKISHQLEIFKSHPEVTVVLESSLYWNSWTNSSRPDVVVPVGAKEGIYDPPYLMETLYPLGSGSAPCPSGIMIKAEVTTRCLFEETFRDEYQLYEDQGFLCKVYLNETVFVSAACNNKYRIRPSSIMATVKGKGKYDIVRSYYLQWFSVYLKNQNAPRRIWALLERARAPYLQPLWYKLKFMYPRKAKAYAAKFLVKLGVISYSKV